MSMASQADVGETHSEQKTELRRRKEQLIEIISISAGKILTSSGVSLPIACDMS